MRRRASVLLVVATAVGGLVVVAPDATSEASPELVSAPASGRTGTEIEVRGHGCFLADGVTGTDGLLFQLVAPDGGQAAAGTVAVERDGTWSGSFVVPAGTPAGTYAVQGRCIAPEYAATEVIPGGSFRVTGEGAMPATAEPEAQAPSDIEPYPAYDGQSTCSPEAKPGMLAFRDMVMAAYPQSGSYGISRDCSIGGSSEHKEGRAWDWANNASSATDRARVDELLNWLLATDRYGNRHAMARRLGVMYIIWNRRIFRLYRVSEGWSSYSGSSPHTDHVHFSLTRAGGAKTTSFWRLGLPGPGAGPGGFTDVRQGVWFEDALLWGVENDVVTGYRDDTFRADLPVSRAQFVNWLWVLAGRPRATRTHGFTDVGPGSWIADPLSWAAERGIVTGYPDGTFRPNASIVRSEVASWVWNLADRPVPDNGSTYTDVPDTRWFAQAAAWLAERGYASGYPDRTFRGGLDLDRAQAVNWLYLARQYADIRPTDWHATAVDWGRYRGVVSGYDDHTFRSNQASTRLNTVQMLWEAMDTPAAAANHTFSDVPTSETAVSWAAAAGIVTGYDDGTFRPTVAVNRGQAVMMLWKIAGEPEAGEPSGFTDVPPTAWNAEAVSWADEQGIVTGFDDGTFRPNQPVNRAQFTVQLSTLAHTEAAWGAGTTKPTTVVFR
jgi:hypothetical protein